MYLFEEFNEYETLWESISQFQMTEDPERSFNLLLESRYNLSEIDKATIKQLYEEYKYKDLGVIIDEALLTESISLGTAILLAVGAALCIDVEVSIKTGKGVLAHLATFIGYLLGQALRGVGAISAIGGSIGVIVGPVISLVLLSTGANPSVLFGVINIVCSILISLLGVALDAAGSLLVDRCIGPNYQYKLFPTPMSSHLFEAVENETSLEDRLLKIDIRQWTKINPTIQKDIQQLYNSVGPDEADKTLKGVETGLHTLAKPLAKALKNISVKDLENNRAAIVTEASKTAQKIVDKSKELLVET